MNKEKALKELARHIVWLKALAADNRTFFIIRNQAMRAQQRLLRLVKAHPAEAQVVATELLESGNTAAANQISRVLGAMKKRRGST